MVSIFGEFGGLSIQRFGTPGIGLDQLCCSLHQNLPTDR